MTTRVYRGFADDDDTSTRRPERKRSHRARVETITRKHQRELKYAGRA